ncbi:MAG: hypothetical protein NTY53_13795 [Kiritimatiellaeota bacterium]|nr:hypothetical protein [Kiritimatiellota bacterium]
MKLFTATLLLALSLLSANGVEARPLAIPTFHCLGLYWSPPGGAAGKEVLVRYRQQGAAEWKTGLPMRYNQIPKCEECLTDYRGSIVHLAPAKTYEVELTLAGTQTSTNLTATTWTEKFPEGVVTRVESGNAPLAITESGTPGAWRVYDGRGATIDVRHQHDACITINASNVILRGFTLKGAGAASNAKKGIIGAIRVEGGCGIVIEDCDISDWGRLDPKTGFGCNCDSAILLSRSIRRIPRARSTSRCSTPAATTSSATTNAAPTSSTCATTASAAAATAASKARPARIPTSTATSSATAGTTASRSKAAAATCACGATTSRKA